MFKAITDELMEMIQWFSFKIMNPPFSLLIRFLCEKLIHATGLFTMIQRTHLHNVAVFILIGNRFRTANCHARKIGNHILLNIERCTW